ncbi:hypothetical protein [Glycomyces rhizosphaerae]|uniref:Septum formation-related domain-containing protein n=1 Tax=Glycomyces rhizosphaerae TaxID=2054422 RepID=A0ABV7Q1U0_9ACTN
MNLNTETFGPIRRLLAVGGVALAGSVALTGCSILEEAASDTTSDTEVSSSQLDAAADAASGDCLPEPPVGGDSSTFAVDCDAPEAFWTITAIEADPGLTAAGEGEIADPQGIYDICGDSVGAMVPGEAWTDWNMIWDQTTGNVDYLFCMEAIDKPNAEGVTPVVPSATDECFDSTQYLYGTYPCDAAGVDSVVIDVVTVDPAEWATADAEALSAECEGDWSYYLPAMDQFGRTTAVYCTA